jgi:predicted Fe-Mo cluster-binding NifX family protein
MKICLPVEGDKGIESTLCAHFGSAPLWLIVDTDSLECKSVINTNQHHSHGMCQPLAILGGEKFDSIVVGGIGMGALNKLKASNIKVYKSAYSSIKETLDAYKKGILLEVDPNQACSGH